VTKVQALSFYCARISHVDRQMRNTVVVVVHSSGAPQRQRGLDTQVTILFFVTPAARRGEEGDASPSSVWLGLLESHAWTNRHWPSLIK
jgi:hypothetical protein